MRLRSVARVLLKEYPRGLKNRLYGKLHDSSIDPSCQMGHDSEVLNSVMGFRSAVAHHGSVRRSTVGRYTSVGRFSKVADANIGAFCSISWDCTIGAHNHPMDHLTSHHYPYSFLRTFAGVPTERGQNEWRDNTESVLIGNDVWIGANSVIIDGVEIGDGSVIAAGAVVTKSVQPFTIVAGVPARSLRLRFEDSICDSILRAKWWEWPEEKLQKFIELFQVPMTLEIAERLEAACDY